MPIIPVITDLMQATPGTISLGQGVVHYGPPPQAIDAIRSFLANPGNHVYQDVPGKPALREAAAGKLERENGIGLAGRTVVITAGSNMGFLNALLCIADPGDEIVLLSPYYFNHEMAVRIANCIPVPVATDPEYQPDLNAIEAAVSARTRAVVTISPNNPTGAVYTREALTGINALCRQRRIFHIHDEAYEYFRYGEAAYFSPLSVPESAPYTIGLYSLSKTYGFASWRIGYMVIPEPMLESVCKIQDTNLICAPVISQYAAVGALAAGRAYCMPYVESLRETRSRVLEMFAPIDRLVDVPAAEGAFYFLLRVRNNPMSSLQLARRLIREHRIALVPGSAFGLQDGCYLRLSYGALKGPAVAEGVGRLVNGLQAMLAGGA